MAGTVALEVRSDANRLTAEHREQRRVEDHDLGSPADGPSPSRCCQTNEAVGAAADFLSFERARDYLERVEGLEVTGTEVTAMVYGTHHYDVVLTARNGRLAGECSCPYGQEGVFCKHCVATGIVAVREGGELRLAESRGGTAAVASAPAGDPLEAWFGRASKHEIIGTLRDVLEEDPSLRQRLEQRAAVIMRDTAAVRETVWDLVGIGGELDHSTAREYAELREKDPGSRRARELMILADGR